MSKGVASELDYHDQILAFLKYALQITEAPKWGRELPFFQILLFPVGTQ